MTKAFNHTRYTYTAAPDNPRLLAENLINCPEERRNYWRVGPLQALVERLLYKFPKWQFILEEYCWSSCRVVSGTEVLGTITYSSGKFQVCNHRIQKKQRRGNAMSTKDGDKAFKLVCKYFSSKTKKERIDRALSDTRNWVNGEQYNTSTNFRMQLTGLAYAARDYIMQDLELYRAAAKANRYDITKCSGLEDLCARSQISETMSKLIQSNVGSILMREGDGYLVSDPEGNEVLSLDDTLLPAPIREALGKLKLLEPRHMLRDVGVRLDENTFYIAH